MTRLPRTRAALQRPFIFLNAASTADGKLAPSNRKFVPFSSPEDQELLMVLRTRADAVMAGARTVDSVKVDLGPGDRRFRQMRLAAGRAEYNLRVIVSGSGTINPKAHIFTRHISPLLLLTTEKGERRVKRWRHNFDAVGVFGETEIDWPRALHWLRTQWQVKRLLCEGGGVLNGALIEAGVVDEIYQTLSPVLMGGRDAPTLADAPSGRPANDQARYLQLKSVRQVGNELFFVWKTTDRTQDLK